MADYKREIGDIVDELLRQGWRVRKGKHWVLYPADRTKPVCFMAQTPSSLRWNSSSWSAPKRTRR